MTNLPEGGGPLCAEHVARGARMRDLGAGVRVPADYGDPTEEYRNLVEGSGVLDLSVWPELRLTGADRVRFLDGLVTCKLAVLEPDEAAYGFFTDVKGRILADGWFDVRPDAIHVELPPGTAATIQEHLAKYKIADRVEVEIANPVRLALPGDDGSTSGLEALPDDRGREDSLHGVPVRVARRLAGGLPSLVITADPVRGSELLGALLESRNLVGHDALESARIEAGHPRFGRDFGPENFPQETGLEKEAVAYDKGCYLGQEVVARIHYRGGVNRHLRGLEIDAAEPPAAGAELHLDDRPLGTLSSVTRSPRFDRILGLAILHRKAEPGTDVEVGKGERSVRAKVVELPWPRDRKAKRRKGERAREE